MSQILAHSSDENFRTKDVILVENVTFESLLLSKNVLKGLTESGFKKPSPIQMKSIPIGRCGFDLIVKSKSGTGKTVVFSVIALENIDTNKNALQVLILAPTREIAVQIQEVISLIGTHIPGLKVESFIGGLPLNEDKQKCKNCHIAVGTPGRMKHLINEGFMNTNSVRLFVLDEADKLMESSFRNDINDIYNNSPAKKQLITTSATYSKELEGFLAEYMCSPTHITADLETPLLLGLKQFAVVVEPCSNVVQQMQVKTEELVKIFSSISFTQCIVFSNYQTRAESISNHLNQKGWQSTHISAAQTQTERLAAVSSLKEFKCRIMLSTDLTARGIDAANVDLVINYDIPLEATTYLHRMGRAGRYGSFGACISLVSGGAELSVLQGILGNIGGSALSIPKLPSFTGNISDLLKLDVSSLEHISGRTDKISKSDAEALSKNKVYNIIKENVKKKSTDSTTNETHRDSNNSSEILSILNNNKEVEEVQKLISNMDTQSILESLASQQFEMDSPVSGEEEEILQRLSTGSSKLETVVPDEKAVINNILHTLLNPKTSDIAEHTDDRGIIEDRCKVSHMDSDEQKKKEIFTKNMALLNVSQILDGQDRGKVNSAETPIQQFLDNLKEQDMKKVSQLSKLSLTDILGTLQDAETFTDSKAETFTDSNAATFTESNAATFTDNNAATFTESNAATFTDSNAAFFTGSNAATFTGSNGSTFTGSNAASHHLDGEAHLNREDIYKFGYDHIVKSDDGRWKTRLDNTETYSNIQEETVENENTSMDDEDAENADDEVEIMKWVPVASSSKKPVVQQTCASGTVELDLTNYEHFDTYFKDCSDHLWQNGLNFDNVDSFDEWFQYEWEAQLFAMRNFVQQNIYVNEMSKYQNTRMAKK